MTDRPPAKPRPTIVDVARRAEVSIGTASRVINGFSNVNAALRARVNEAIAELGYRPNTTAQDMRRNQTRLVGIVVRDITVPALAQFVKSAQDVLFGAGYSVLSAASDNDVERELALLDALAQRRIDGLITTVASEKDRRLESALVSLNVPVVLLDRDKPDGFDAVKVDHVGGTCHAVEHLIDLGHRRIGLLTGAVNVWPAFARVEGYEAAHAARRIPVDRDLIFAESFTEAFAMDKTGALLAVGATAIIAGGIAMLPGVLQALRTLGRSVPDNISIVSGSDSSLAQLVTPPVTAVRWDYAGVGTAAARLLMERMSKKSTSPVRHIAVPTELVLRGSSAPPGRQRTQ